MNAADYQAYGIAAAALAYLSWRYLSFRSVKGRLPELLKHGAVIVDVRSPGEYASGSSKGSINIPVAELEKRLSVLDRDKPVVLCCASGTRSAIARAILRKHGFTNVFNAGPWKNTVA